MTSSINGYQNSTTENGEKNGMTIKKRKRISKKDLRSDKKWRTAVDRLDEYINDHENMFGRLVIVEDDYSDGTWIRRALKPLVQLKRAVAKNENHKRQAYENLKRSNEIMKKTISKLTEEMKSYRESIRGEFVNFENLNTDRLIHMDPSQMIHCSGGRAMIRNG